MKIREAAALDAEAMSGVLQELVAAGKRSRAADAEFVLSHYIEHPHRLHCFVALDGEDMILGFQSLKIARDGNPYGTPIGCGIFGTHVRPSAARMGVGSALRGDVSRGARGGTADDRGLHWRRERRCPRLL